MSIETEVVSADMLADIFNTPIADVQRLAAKGVFHADAEGKFLLKASILAYTRHWVKLFNNMQALLAGAKADALVSASELSEKLGLDEDELWAYVAAGALHCDEDRMFRLTNTLMAFMEILDETTMLVGRFI